MRGGQNVEFHYYYKAIISEHRKCLFSLSLLRHQNIESVNLISIKVIRTSKITTTYGILLDTKACGGLG